jgi:hypothetical protein
MSSHRRTPRDELADATAHGHVYLRELVRAQLSLSLIALVAFGGVVGVLPLILATVPWLGHVHLAGVPLSVLLLVIPPFPLFVAIGWLYRRRADALDEVFRTLVRDE